MVLGFDAVFGVGADSDRNLISVIPADANHLVHVYELAGVVATADVTFYFEEHIETHKSP
ncbi:hypothetical protein D3C86_2028810 [compost metagenome]